MTSEINNLRYARPAAWGGANKHNERSHNEMHMNTKLSKLALITVAAVALGGCGKGEGPSANGYEAIVAEGTAPAHQLSEGEWTAAIDKWRAYFRVNPTKGLDVDLACSDMRRPLIKALRQAQSPDDKKRRKNELEAFWENHGEIKAKCLIAMSPHRYMPDGWKNDEGLAAAVKEWKRVREERIASEKKDG